MAFNDTVILINKNGMGEADNALQIKLISTYLRLINENGDIPAVICFYTDGIHLVLKESPVLDTLEELERKGVRLVICGTCLDFYEQRENVAVGIIGGMTDIIEAQSRASKVITL